MHKPNHNDKDFFDLLARPEGVVPKNFEASPPDNTRTNISYTPPKPTLNLGNPIGSSLIEGAQEGMQERLPAEISNAPMSQKEMADIAMGMITPFGGTVRAVNAGVRAGAKLLPKVQRGDFEVYKGTKLLREAKQMPDVTNQGGIRRIIEGKNNKIIESVTPQGINSSGGNKAKHAYRLRPLDDFGKEIDGKKVFNELAEIKFNMSDKFTPSGTPYQLITDIATFTPKGTSKDYGKLMTILMKRMDKNWAIGEDDASLDALYGMTRSWLKKAVDVEFYNIGGQKQRYYTPKDRFFHNGWIKNNSPFAKRIEEAQKALKEGYETSQGIDSPILRDAIDDLAREVTTTWLKSGKVSGKSSNLFEGRIVKNQVGDEVGILQSNAYYIKNFKEKIAALLGMNGAEFDKYLDSRIDEK